MRCFLKLNLPRKTANFDHKTQGVQCYKTGPKLWIENQFLVNHFKHKYNKFSQKNMFCNIIT